MDVRLYKKQLKSMRKELISSIVTLVTPYMWESNFIESRIGEPHVYTKLFVLEKPIKLSYLDDEVLGFTKYSIIKDFYVGMVVQDYESVALEDLLKLFSFLEKRDIDSLRMVTK